MSRARRSTKFVIPFQAREEELCYIRARATHFQRKGRCARGSGTFGSHGVFLRLSRHCPHFRRRIQVRRLRACAHPIHRSGARCSPHAIFTQWHHTCRSASASGLFSRSIQRIPLQCSRCLAAAEQPLQPSPAHFGVSLLRVLRPQALQWFFQRLPHIFETGSRA